MANAKIVASPPHVWLSDPVADSAHRIAVSRRLLEETQGLLPQTAGALSRQDLEAVVTPDAGQDP